jgi:transposase
MATITETRKIKQAIATPKMNKLISDRHDLHEAIKIELYRSGMTYRAIADLFSANGVQTTHQTVSKVITRAGINRTKAPQNHLPVKAKTLEKEQQIIGLHGQGLTLKAIATQVGSSISSVSKLLKLNGCVTKRSYDRGIDKPQIIKLREDGLSIEAIAKQVGTTGVTVQRVLRSQETPLSTK